MTTDAWDGRPENPGRDGAHVLSWRGDDPEQAWWIAKDREWLFSGRDTCTAITAGNNARYLGPCLRPDEVAAREAAAAEAMREACAKICDRNASIVDVYTYAGPKEGGPYAPLARKFRSLPLPAADALARALEQARAEEREACARVVQMRCCGDPDCKVHPSACPQKGSANAIRARGKEDRDA